MSRQYRNASLLPPLGEVGRRPEGGLYDASTALRPWLDLKGESIA
jgi:hypothetical protein